MCESAIESETFMRHYAEARIPFNLRGGSKRPCCIWFTGSNVNCLCHVSYSCAAAIHFAFRCQSTSVSCFFLCVWLNLYHTYSTRILGQVRESLQISQRRRVRDQSPAATFTLPQTFNDGGLTYQRHRCSLHYNRLEHGECAAAKPEPKTKLQGSCTRAVGYDFQRLWPGIAIEWPTKVRHSGAHCRSSAPSPAVPPGTCLAVSTVVYLHTVLCNTSVHGKVQAF